MLLRCAGSSSEGNCYSLTDSSGQVLLIEAGVSHGKLCRFIHWNITNVVGCIVTHHHMDHVASASRLRMKGVKTYLPFELDEHRKEVVFGNFKIKSFPLTNSMNKFVHTNGDGTECPIFGFLIEHDVMGKMVYITDCEYCRYTFRKLKVNHILIGVNYQKEYTSLDEAKFGHVVTGHMSEDTALEFIKANDTDALQNVIACHLSEESCNADKLLGNLQNAVSAGVNVQIAVPGIETELYKDCPFG